MGLITLTDDEFKQGMKNIGVDITCGACASIFSTGANTNAHTCKERGRSPFADRMAKAINKFRNLKMLGRMNKLRGTPEYSELCLAWEEYRDLLEESGLCVFCMEPNEFGACEACLG